MNSYTDDILFVSRSGDLVFSAPADIISAHTLDEVKPCLEQVASGVAHGLYAAGFIAYEAAPAFDIALKAHASGHLPLAWFGLYQKMEHHAPGTARDGNFETGSWTALVPAWKYQKNVKRIRDLIADGDTYQVNYTFPLQADFQGDTLNWFRQLSFAQQADFCAYVRAGRFHILSASPELFFRLKGHTLETRPMKGTRPRGRWSEDDNQNAICLAKSKKDRAENVMIVDLLRNDMGRISEFDSVRVKKLFDVERYPTVWQMTSTIVSHTSASVPEIISALFPCGSVTGAPKPHTMEIIRDMEPYPRGVYCGTIGWWAPDRQAEFNVAIRTVTVDTETGQAFYNVGSGITYGSSPEDEYEECLTKAELLTCGEPDFELIESLRFDGQYFLLCEHMERIAKSADYFGYRFKRGELETALAEKAMENRLLTSGIHHVLKVRVLLSRDGSFRIEAEPAKPLDPLRLGFAAEPVDSHNVFLYHKTTQRAIYKQAMASRPDCDDVLLWNRQGEITESTIANIVLDVNGERLTPPVASGLLQGTFRKYLLGQGKIREQVLTRNDVTRARSIHLINSVRQWIDVKWIDPPLHNASAVALPSSHSA